MFLEVQWQGRKLEHQNKSFWAEASLEGGVEREGVVCMHKYLGLAWFSFLSRLIGNFWSIICSVSGWGSLEFWEEREIEDKLEEGGLRQGMSPKLWLTLRLLYKK